MKTYNLFFTVLSLLLFATACQKENIQAADFVNLEDTKQKIEGLLADGQLVDFEILNKTSPELENEKEKPRFETAPIPADDPATVCDQKIEKLSQELQALANGTCEIQFGEVECMMDGAIVYAMLMAEPELDCGVDVPAEEYYEHRPADNQQIEVAIYATLVRGGGYQLTAYSPENTDPYHFDADVYLVEWTKGGRHIGTGARLDKIILEGRMKVEITDLRNRKTGTATILIQNNRADRPKEINEDK